MKKIFAYCLLVGFLFLQIQPIVVASESSLPDLPNLPDFDMVQAPEGMDAFSPSASPPQVAPKQSISNTPAPNNVKNVTQKPTQTSLKTISKPAQKKTKAINKPVQQKPATVNKPTTNTVNNSYYKNNLKSSFVLPKGKKFKVQLLSGISSSTGEGTKVTFKSIYPETATYITIPSGTVFHGKVVDTHGPQWTGNGGLIVIEVNQMVYKGAVYDIDAKVSVANGKHIFLNNIKGKRMYFQSIPKAMKPGTTFFKKMWRVTCNLAKNDNGVEIILTPFSLLTGTVVYAVNFVASPVLAIFYKGKSISIPANSQFTVQLRENAVLLK